METIRTRRGANKRPAPTADVDVRHVVGLYHLVVVLLGRLGGTATVTTKELRTAGDLEWTPTRVRGAQAMRISLKAVVLVCLLATQASAFTLVCLGDSNTHPYLFGTPQWCDVLQARHPDWQVINPALSGGLTSAAGAFVPGLPPDEPRVAEHQWQRALEQLEGARPDAIMVALGTNDLYWTHDPAVVASALLAFRARLVAETGAPVFLGMVPRRWDVFRTPDLQRATNRLLARQLERGWRVPFDRVSFRYARQPDSVHFNAAGHERRADYAERALWRAGGF